MKSTSTHAFLVALVVVVGLGFALAQDGMMGPGGYGGFRPGGGHGAYGHHMYGPGAYGPGAYGSGRGGGMMGGMGMMGGAMMGSAMGPLPADAAPLALPELEARLRAVLPQFPAGAAIDDVMPFTNNVYAQVVDGAGNGLAEVLVDRFTGVVTPEPGPNMMWNLGNGNGFAGRMGAYGGSMMYGQPARGDRVGFDLQEAEDVANRFLAGYAPGAAVLASQSFSGYYTFDYGQDKVVGMLSVNAASGAVWPHTWHGAFLGEEP